MQATWYVEDLEKELLAPARTHPATINDIPSTTNPAIHVADPLTKPPTALPALPIAKSLQQLEKEQLRVHPTSSATQKHQTVSAAIHPAKSKRALMNCLSTISSSALYTLTSTTSATTSLQDLERKLLAQAESSSNSTATDITMAHNTPRELTSSLSLTHSDCSACTASSADSADSSHDGQTPQAFQASIGSIATPTNGPLSSTKLLPVHTEDAFTSAPTKHAATEASFTLQRQADHAAAATPSLEHAAHTHAADTTFIGQAGDHPYITSYMEMYEEKVRSRMRELGHSMSLAPKLNCGLRCLAEDVQKPLGKGTYGTFYAHPTRRDRGIKIVKGGLVAGVTDELLKQSIDYWLDISLGEELMALTTAQAARSVIRVFAYDVFIEASAEGDFKVVTIIELERSTNGDMSTWAYNLISDAEEIAEDDMKETQKRASATNTPCAAADTRTPLRRWMSAFTHVFVSLLEAVAELHAHGIVHGDLKPQNATLSSSGKVKLIDFGSGIFFAEGEKKEKHKHHRCTFMYSPPENQADDGTNPGLLTPSCDVWGAVLIYYELCLCKFALTYRQYDPKQEAEYDLVAKMRHQVFGKPLHKDVTYEANEPPLPIAQMLCEAPEFLELFGLLEHLVMIEDADARMPAAELAVIVKQWLEYYHM